MMMEDKPATLSRTYFDIIVVLFAVILVISNVAATKIIQIGPLVFDGGAILFPLTYVLGDVIAEVYGLKRAKRAILIGLCASVLAALTFLAVQMLPASPEYTNQSSFEAVLGFVPTIVIASIAGYAVGQLLNAFIVVKLKAKMQSRKLWVRLVLSTIVGESADTIIFCTIAFAGVLSGGSLINYIIVGIAYKVAVEIMVLPVTYRLVRILKSRDALAIRN